MTLSSFRAGLNVSEQFPILPRYMEHKFHDQFTGHSCPILPLLAYIEGKYGHSSFCKSFSSMCPSGPTANFNIEVTYHIGTGRVSLDFLQYKY